MSRTTRRDLVFLIASLVFLCCTLVLNRGSAWLYQVTAPGARPHGVFGLTLPGVDIGVDAWPSGPGKAGYVQFWYYGHNADEYQPFLRLPGRPALPLVRPHRLRLAPDIRASTPTRLAHARL